MYINYCIKILSMLCVLGLLIFGYQLLTTDNAENNPASRSEMPYSFMPNKSPHELVLRDILFKGVNKDLNKYTLEAKQAIKTSDTQYTLNNINILYDLSEDKSLIVNAKNAELNNATQLLKLRNDVECLVENATFNSDTAQINLNNKDILSNSPTMISYKNSNITSDRFSSHDNNNLIKFKGNVATMINLSDF